MCQSMAYRCQKSELLVSVFLVSVVQTVTRGGNPAIPRNVKSNNNNNDNNGHIERDSYSLFTAP